MTNLADFASFYAKRGYPITTLKGSNVSTNASTSNELYAIPVGITVRRRGKLDPQKFRRRNEHFFRLPELQLGDTDSWNAYLQLVNQTVDQFGSLV